MNRSSFAFFVALIIHLLIILLLWFSASMLPERPKPAPKEKKMKISLKELPKKHKKSGDTKQKQPPSPIAPPMPKGSQLKKIVKAPLVKLEPKKPVKKPKLNPKPKPKKPRPKPKPKVAPLPPEKPYIPLIDKNIKPIKKVKKPKEEKSLFDILSEDKSMDEKKKTQKKTSSKLGTASSTKEMKELYGNKWGELTAGQQKYMLDNQEIMRRITQQVLTRVARVNLKSNLNVNRSNIIEFKLHPNGDMSDFRFIEKSGYYILDDTTKETIEYAYSRYPRPKETIPVRYNVYYNLAR